MSDKHSEGMARDAWASRIGLILAMAATPSGWVIFCAFRAGGAERRRRVYDSLLHRSVGADHLQNADDVAEIAHRADRHSSSFHLAEESGESMLVTQSRSADGLNSFS